MKLDYVDPESTEQDSRIHKVSGEMAGRAYNALCKMIGGRWPDCRIETYAPEAHEFFMTLFSEGEEDKKVSCQACNDTGYTHGPPGTIGMTPCYLCGKGDWVGIPHEAISEMVKASEVMLKKTQGEGYIPKFI